MEWLRPAILHSSFCLLHSPLGGFVGALWEPCGRFRLALGWPSVRNPLPIKRPLGGLGVALGGFNPPYETEIAPIGTEGSGLAPPGGNPVLRANPWNSCLGAVWGWSGVGLGAV